jgi:hypothetical protein
MTEDQEYQMRQELYGPTPKEIRERCLEIQKTWDPWTRAYRAGLVRGEPRNWQWINGRSHCYETEFAWTAPQYVISMTLVEKSDRRRETVVWRRV